ncbi:hypothetical protein CIRG_06356 [Coccidioides immitis RMSCC 2394]|uniref:Uncharacterized protein n=1 Tax=Coccidioides immitis RMSCC 2394 TaxID=404692 RepID=A0A0J6YGD1_COCIT|nr:hypothetical protein CIRG_06356 [Coccidioides immitis RMSCC 2394]
MSNHPFLYLRPRKVWIMFIQIGSFGQYLKLKTIMATFDSSLSDRPTATTMTWGP